MKLLPLLIALMLGGCASYWIPDASVAGPVDEVQYVEAPCGNANLYGCYSKGLRLIQINSTAAPYMQADALSHERKHAAGYRHLEWPSNGRIWRGED